MNIPSVYSCKTQDVKAIINDFVANSGLSCLRLKILKLEGCSRSGVQHGLDLVVLPPSRMSS
jgi:hypothetical protein